MCSLGISTLAAALLVLQASIADAQSGNTTHATCDTDLDRDFDIRFSNATGSYTGPGFAPVNANTSTTSDWIWNTTITVNKKNKVFQSFSIDTPSLRGVKAGDVPFQVCAIAFTALPRSTYSKGQQDNGDCSQTLNPECAKALTQLASQSQGSGSSLCANIMSQIAQNTPQQCQSFGNFGNAISATLFSKPEAGDSVEESSTNCSAETNTTVHPLFSMSTSPLNTMAFNETEYDEAIYRVVPFLTTVVSDTTQIGAGASASSSQSSLLCMRAKNITPGSRSPPPLQDATKTTVTASPSPTPDKPKSPKSSAPRGRNLSSLVLLGFAVTFLFVL
ncbi:MAG: hypothetical protein Q9220_007280 [cf. Caloplaca sp. 1 TL-2023]